VPAGGALEQELLPEGVQRWLGIGKLAELIEKATVDRTATLLA